MQTPVPAAPIPTKRHRITVHEGQATPVGSVCIEVHRKKKHSRKFVIVVTERVDAAKRSAFP